jgi:hypothetical protein
MPRKKSINIDACMPMKRGISAAADVRKKAVVVQVMRAGIDISKRKCVCIRKPSSLLEGSSDEDSLEKAARLENRRER